MSQCSSSLGAHLRRVSPVSLHGLWALCGLGLVSHSDPPQSLSLPTGVLCPVSACPPALFCPLLGTGTPALVLAFQIMQGQLTWHL